MLPAENHPGTLSFRRRVLLRKACVLDFFFFKQFVEMLKLVKIRNPPNGPGAPLTLFRIGRGLVPGVLRWATPSSFTEERASDTRLQLLHVSGQSRVRAAGLSAG